MCWVRALQSSGNIGWLERRMRRNLISLLAVGVPGVCLLIGGAMSHEYLLVALGGVLVIASADRLNRKQAPSIPARDYKKQRLSFGLAGIIGASLAVIGFVSDGNWIGVAGVVILIGSLLQLYRVRLSNGR